MFFTRVHIILKLVAVTRGRGGDGVRDTIRLPNKLFSAKGFWRPLTNNAAGTLAGRGRAAAVRGKTILIYLSRGDIYKYIYIGNNGKHDNYS